MNCEEKIWGLDPMVDLIYKGIERMDSGQLRLGSTVDLISYRNRKNSEEKKGLGANSEFNFTKILKKMLRKKMGVVVVVVVTAALRESPMEEAQGEAVAEEEKEEEGRKTDGSIEILLLSSDGAIGRQPKGLSRARDN